MEKSELLNIAKTSDDIEQLITLSFGDLDTKLAILQNSHCTYDLFMSIINSMTDQQITDSMHILSLFKYHTVPKKIIENPNCPKNLLIQDFITGNYNGYRDRTYSRFHKKYIKESPNELELTDEELDKLLNTNTSLYTVSKIFSNLNNKITINQRYKIIDTLYANDQDLLFEILDNMFFYYDRPSDTLTNLALYINKCNINSYRVYRYLIEQNLLTKEELDVIIKSLPITSTSYTIDIFKLAKYCKNVVPINVIKQVLHSSEISSSNIIDIIDNNIDKINDILSDATIVSKIKKDKLEQYINTNNVSKDIIYIAINTYNDIELDLQKYKDNETEFFIYFTKNKILNPAIYDIVNMIDLSNMSTDDKINLLRDCNDLHKKSLVEPLLVKILDYNTLSIICVDTDLADIVSKYDIINKVKISAEQLNNLCNICVNTALKYDLIYALLSTNIDMGMDQLINFITKYETTSRYSNVTRYNYILNEQQIQLLKTSNTSVEFCNLILANSPNSILEVSDDTSITNVTDYNKLEKMLADPNCSIETINKILNTTKSSYYNRKIFKAIINNPSITDDIFKIACIKYVHSIDSEYNLIKEFFNTYSSKISKDIYNTMIDYICDNKLTSERWGDIRNQLMKFPYYTKEIEIKLIEHKVLNTIDKHQFEYTEDELTELYKKNHNILQSIINLDNCPKIILLIAIKDLNSRTAVNHNNMDSITLDKIITICDPSIYNILLCDKCSVKSILHMIKNNYYSPHMIDILRNKDFTDEELKELINIRTSISEKILLGLPNINQNYLVSIFE